MPRSPINTPTPAALADAALGYLAENPEELLQFMQTAGLDPQSLRAAMGSIQFQRGLIDYVAGNEPVLLALCANLGIAPEQFMRVWHEQNPG